jgi:hypothetical protein
MVSKLILVLSTALTLSGCFVSFKNPLPASQKLAPDERLPGKWTGAEKGKPYSVYFEKNSRGQMTVAMPENPSYRNPLCQVMTTKISDHDYMIFRPDDPGDKDYMVARYSLDGANLKICMLDSDRVKEAIRQRKLKGSGDYAPWGGALITESSEAVLKFLKSSDSDAMFICPEEFNFRKVPN